MCRDRELAAALRMKAKEKLSGGREHRRIWAYRRREWRGDWDSERPRMRVLYMKVSGEGMWEKRRHEYSMASAMETDERRRSWPRMNGWLWRPVFEA